MTRLRTLVDMLRASWIPGLSLVQARLMRPFYRTTFLASAARSGVLEVLNGRSLDRTEIAHAVGAEVSPELLGPWLDIGAEVGILARAGTGEYRLRGWDARLLARDQSGVARAGLLEMVLYHQEAIMSAPRFALRGGKLRLEDQDPTVIARSTRLVQPMIESSVRNTVRSRDPRKWLEVGAGDGHYAAYAAGLDPALDVTCLEVQTELVDAMSERFASLPVGARLRTRHGDVRTFDTDERYDVVTLHNLLYYFSRNDQREVLERCRRVLRPGGTLLLTTSVPGRVTPVSALDLWFRCSDFGSCLPTEGEIADVLANSGFRDVEMYRPLPLFSLVAVTATSSLDGESQ